MSEFKGKSEIYRAATALLNESGSYAPVGHTAYYSCFLLMEHIRSFSESFSTDELDIPVFDTSGSHEKTINEITQYIQSTNRRDSQHFHSNICDLKRLRSSADYKNEPFSQYNANRSKVLMELTLSILSRYE